MSHKKAVVLLSGGLDSTVTLYLARKQGYECHCLIFDYGQFHRREIQAAKKIARAAGCKWQLIKISLPWKGSSLLDRKQGIPADANRRIPSIGKIPNTYVPARNIIFLSFALSFAEAIRARAIFIGAHTGDYSGYPDCRPEFYRAFAKAGGTGTRAGVEDRGIKIITPIIHKNKSEIIKLGEKLKTPLGLTWSCYQGKRQPCGRCDSCYYRQKGFYEAGIKDPATTRMDNKERIASDRKNYRDI